MNVSILRDLEDDEDGNLQHIAEHGLEKADVALVVDFPVGSATSDSSGRLMVFGYTTDNRYIAVIFEVIEEDVVYPVTAFEVPEPR